MLGSVLPVRPECSQTPNPTPFLTAPRTHFPRAPPAGATARLAAQAAAAPGAGGAPDATLLATAKKTKFDDTRGTGLGGEGVAKTCPRCTLALNVVVHRHRLENCPYCNQCYKATRQAVRKEECPGHSLAPLQVDEGLA